MEPRSIARALVIGATLWMTAGTATATEAGDTKAAARETCFETGNWVATRKSKTLLPDAHFADIAQKDVVLLGETHDNAEHHRWQLHTLAGIHSRQQDMVIGFEMFPRRVQPVLDRWVKGELTTKAFLNEVGWREVWGFDPGLYMPLFEFARMHRIPIVALNVDRSLVSRVGAEGWQAVPEEVKEGVGNPAAPLAAYKRELAKVYLQKQSFMSSSSASSQQTGSKQAAESEDEKIAGILQEPAFNRFVEAQLTWDRAMAEALADANKKYKGAVVVGVIGSGHLSYSHGVPHQLDALGVTDMSVLIPVEGWQACQWRGSDYADAMFIVNTPEQPDSSRQRPRLGVMVRSENDSAVIDRVIPDSVAEAALLKKGDRIIMAAGVKINNSSALIEVISRQAPGTWLPLTVRRNETTVDLIAKFPPQPEKGS